MRSLVFIFVTLHYRWFDEPSSWLKWSYPKRYLCRYLPNMVSIQSRIRIIHSRNLICTVCLCVCVCVSVCVCVCGGGGGGGYDPALKLRRQKQKKINEDSFRHFSRITFYRILQMQVSLGIDDDSYMSLNIMCFLWISTLITSWFRYKKYSDTTTHPLCQCIYFESVSHTNRWIIINETSIYIAIFRSTNTERWSAVSRHVMSFFPY